MKPTVKSRLPAVRRVMVTVSGGVADISYKPAGVEVHIIDYDVDGEDESRLDRDRDGHPCVIARWEASQRVPAVQRFPPV